VPKYLKRESKLGQTNAKYASMVENLDKNIGVLIKGLKDAGKFENTFIIFTSDNGGLYGITSQKPLRSGKGSYYEGGIKVPFFFVWQNKISKNTQSDFPISNMDILPTILSLTPYRNKKNIADGADLSSLLLHGKNLKERPLFWHFPIYLQSKKWKGFANENRDALFRTRPGSAVRLGNWKLIYYYENDDLELFNLKKDVSETKNIAALYPEKAIELTKTLKKWCLQTGAPIPKEPNKKYNFKSNKNM
jgi:arylsulfatase A-like enzyme